MPSTTRHTRPKGHVLYTSEPDRTGVRSGLALDVGFCGDPTCDAAHLKLTAVEETADGVREDPTVSPAASTATIHMDSGEVDIDAGPLELARRLDALVGTPALAKLLEERRRADRAERDRAWIEADWSDWVPGRLVAFGELYPDIRPVAFRHEGRVYLVDDQYCITAGCGCRDVVLAIIETDGEDAQVVVDSFVLDRNTGTISEHGETTPIRRQRPLLASLRSAYPDLRAVLERRGREVERAGPQIRALAGTARATLESKPPGRNAPCPCGSGRKYKKCCMD